MDGGMKDKIAQCYYCGAEIIFEPCIIDHCSGCEYCDEFDEYECNICAVDGEPSLSVYDRNPSMV
jgi:hypothetical protein